MRGLLLLPLIAGCGGESLLFLDRPWDADRTVVLVAMDAEGRAIRAPWISTGGTLELSLAEEPPFTLFAWVFAPEVLAPSCPIAIGGEGFPVPSQSEVWMASVEELDAPAVFALTDPPPLDIKTTCTVPLPCPTPTVESMRIDELAGSDIIAILPLSPTRALIAGDGSTAILEVDGEQRRMLDTTGIITGMRTLARDGDRIYGSTEDQIFRFELSDERFEIETSTRQKGLELVPGGPPVVYGSFGVREVFTEIASATTAIERIGVEVRHVRMVASNSGLLIDENNLIHAFDGFGWSVENPGSSSLTVESFRRVDGDETSFMTVGKRENAFLRSEGIWEQLPLPFNRGIGLSDVESLGGGRFITVGEFGTGAILQEGIWCTYVLEVVADRTIYRIAKSEDPNVLFAGTLRDEAGYPHLLRITLE